MSVSGAAVISETFPMFQNITQIGARQGGDGGKTDHPSVPIGQDGFDLSLLQHDLGDPDGIRVAGPAPGQIPGIALEPSQETGNEGLKFIHRMLRSLFYGGR